MQSVLCDFAAVVLGGGAGSRLYPLTKQRAKPAVPIGGAYRLIDVPMSNCINSGISKIYILTQFNSTSLNRHLARTYNFGSGVRFGGDGFVEVLAATQTPTDKEWFQGTADAVRQYAWLFEDIKNRVVEDIVILSGDHLYVTSYHCNSFAVCCTSGHVTPSLSSTARCICMLQQHRNTASSCSDLLHELQQYFVCSACARCILRLLHTVHTSPGLITTVLACLHVRTFLTASC